MNDYKELIENLGRIIFREKTATYGVGEINIRSMATECKQAIEQLVKERDAAVADLKENRVCTVCVFGNDDALFPCDDCCSYTDSYNCFEWRGVQEDNDEID